MIIMLTEWERELRAPVVARRQKLAQEAESETERDASADAITEPYSEVANE